ncbi:lipid A deacylase LpxR family protein [Desulfoluna spongiiphila]|uniref:Uncharacterized protein n=1 Tax=Desulfoluna spongiiphila TaxID=419481 RepID=A0A1G5AEU5_9BACT|nr:lipid A deacylase LpxR family protein [Desulfoluna spongiiphila]SCX76395.1 hypothetical protein SAMN05216233_101115 [Desulfoluna spongiiphila]
MLKCCVVLVGFLLAMVVYAPPSEGAFHLRSPYNTGIFRFEIDNDAVWKKDSNFSNGWSLQYHTPCYDGWDVADVPGLVAWVGTHVPSMDAGDAIVRYSYGVGQNMLTPGDLSMETVRNGDLPYAGTVTVSANWQSFNRDVARNLQVSVGLLGRQSFAKEFQTFVHNDLGMGKNPKGWGGQRKTEPLINLGYQYVRRLAYVGRYTNGWAGQLAIEANATLGNLYTSVGSGLSARFGWNIQEGFGPAPAPPGVGFYQAAFLPKPAFASPHSIEMVLGASGTGLIYSTLYDGSRLTDDDREVSREDVMGAWLMGVNYHYFELFSIRAHFQVSTKLLKEDLIPNALPGKKKTHGDVSFGALMVDVYF